MRTRVLSAVVLALASASVLAQTFTVRGTVSYRERMALLPGSVLIVHVDRFSGADQHNLSELKMDLGGHQVPLGFSLSVTPGEMAKGVRLGLRAEIRKGDQVIFESPSATIFNPKSKMALALNLVRAHGPAYAIFDKTWTLVELQGTPVKIQNPPTLVLEQDGKFNGSAGVNRVFGNYEWQKPWIQIDPMGTTLMAGPEDAMELEQRYLKALPMVSKLTIEEGQLVLLRGQKVIARFNAKG